MPDKGSKKRAEALRCEWISERDAFQRFATHAGGVESGGHIKPLHWYIACRLVLEGGFHPDEITPRPPFEVERKGRRLMLSYNPNAAGGGERTVLGGLKTKNVDVVVTKKELGPVMAVSCKGVTKAYRNLTNRMEETVGECTNLHITYPAMVLGYFAVLRANRTVQDVKEAPDIVDNEGDDPEQEEEQLPPEETDTPEELIKSNDIAVLESGDVVDGIIRFHAALREMTLRRGIRNDISRYEAIALGLIEPKGDRAGTVFPLFPPVDSSLRIETFFQTLYQRYEERFVYGAPLFAKQGITPRLKWAATSPVFARSGSEPEIWPRLNFVPRLTP